MDPATQAQIDQIEAAANGVLNLAAMVPGIQPEVAVAGIALNLVEKLVPVVAAQVGKGAISQEYQQALLARFAVFRTNLDSLFAGPEWKVQPDPTS